MVITIHEPAGAWDVAQNSLCKSFSAQSFKLAGALLDRPVPISKAQSNQASRAVSEQLSAPNTYRWTGKSYLVPTMRSKKH